MFFHTWVGIARVPIVGTLAYVALVLFIRISGKRTLTKLNAFDLVVTVALGSTLSSVLLNDSIALAEGLVAMATLIGLQFVVTFASVRSSRIEGLVKSEPTLLLRDGRFLDAALKAQRVTRDEVLSALRSEGVSDVEAVHAVVLETDGSMSVLENRFDRAAAPTLRSTS